MTALLLLWALLLNIIHATNIGKANFLTDAAKKNGAVCLDGTPGNYYFAEGEEKTKYVMFLQGGGWCYNENGCWSRTENHLGSTVNDSETVDMNSLGFLGNNASLSPLFYNWNKIYARYCDGFSFGGDAYSPIVNSKNSSQLMYYRGKRILNAIFEDLALNYGLNDATDFVVGGGSAGGLATFIHTNYIAVNFFDLTKTKLVSMPDVGFFIEYNGWNGKTQWANHIKYGYNMHNVSSSIIDSPCFDNKNWNNSECVFAQNIAGDNIIPTFALNSQYDQYQAQSILGTGTSNATLLNEYGQNFTRILINNYLSRNSVSGNIYGAYIDGCYHHDAINPIYFSGLNIDGDTQATAFMKFYNGLGKENNKVFWYQNVTYPCDKCCPSTQNDEYLTDYDYYDYY